MPCRSVKLPVGAAAIVCTRHKLRRCKVCGGAATLLCDFPDPARASGTCDAGICREHAIAVGPDRHHCPRHRQEESSL